MTEALAWLDGQLVPARTAAVPAADRGLLLGDGVFETMRCEDGVVAHLADHLARLREGARTLGFTAGVEPAAVAAALRAIAAEGARAIRLTVTRGTGPRGLLPPACPSPTVLMTAALLPESAPVRAVVSRITRRNEHSPLSRIKSIGYGDGILARIEAAERRAEEAILLNTAGAVAEASAANLFCLLNGSWVTPRIADGALPGLARARLMRVLNAIERRIGPAELRASGGVVLSNSLGLRAVTMLDGVALPAPGLPPLS